MEYRGGFAGYYGVTQVHPLALLLVAVLCILVLTSTRRTALVPMLLATTTIPMAQRLVIAGADFTLLRILLLVYVIRIVRRREWAGCALNRVDKAVIIWAASGAIIMFLNFGSAQVLINRAGWAYDILLTYFACRCLFRSWSDVLVLAKAAALISLPTAAFFMFEWSTQYNVFHVLGGVPEYTWIREGRIRCQGPFAHPIIAGSFWAALLPLIWMLFRGERRDRRLCIAGTLGATVVILATSSTTPYLSLFAALGGMSLFVYRRHRTRMWVGLIGTLAMLHFFVMKAPVWHLISRIDLIGGSTGWHRYIIFDSFLDHFADWYLTGYATPMDWRWQMRDITNQFIIEGLNGGALTLIFFVLVLCRCFANVGRTLTQAPASRTRTNINAEWYAWSIGVMVFVHVVTFWGVSYFGQLSALLYMQFALAVSVALLFQNAEQREPDKAPDPKLRRKRQRWVRN